MIKSYSKLNIIQQRLSRSSSSKGFLQYIFGNKNYITIEIPYYDYLRGKVFIDDIHDNHGKDLYMNLDISILIHLLYTEFLGQVKKGKTPYRDKDDKVKYRDMDNEQIAYFIITMKEKFQPRKVKEQRILKEVSMNHFFFDSIMEPEEESSDINVDSIAYLDLKLRESDILRGEILLHELSPYFNGIEITVEELIAMLYLDFIEKIKNIGYSGKMQLSIKEYLS